MSRKKRGARFAALMALEKNGRLRPDDLVRAARAESHPLHNEFTWDDTLAAKERRHDQARAIIRDFHYEIVVHEIGPVSVVNYIADPQYPDNDHMFRNIGKIRSRADVEAIFDAEIRQLHGVAKRVLGVAISKMEILGRDRIAALRSICQSLESLLKE